MVARGDLGIEMPIEQVPMVQKMLLRTAGELARPSITATQMLDSMVTSSRPTRAEVADVANAILDGTDAVMLSQETAVGNYPVGVIEMMASIAVTTEREAPYQDVEREPRHARLPRPRVHAGPRRLRGGGRPAARRAGHPDAVRSLGATGQRPSTAGADLRAVARQGDGAPLLADVGRAIGPHAQARGDRGADRRRRAARARARLVQARPTRRDHRRFAQRASREAPACSRFQTL